MTAETFEVVGELLFESERVLLGADPIACK